MSHNINPSIANLAVSIDNLIPLDGNPRVGNVDAIMASYNEFGQVKPIVIRPNEDGSSTVIAGNHQVEAAKRLGWTHIAAVQLEADDKRAIAFAMADNRTMELGHSDNDLIATLLGQISEDYTELLDGLEWDAFEIASIEVSAEKYDSVLERGYVSPEIQRDTMRNLTDSIDVSINEDGDTKIDAKPDADTKALVATGSTTFGASGSSHAVVQYTLVFDDAEQQRRWYSFIRWIRNEPAYDGETTAQRLMSFIDSHSEV